MYIVLLQDNLTELDQIVRSYQTKKEKEDNVLLKKMDEQNQANQRSIKKLNGNMKVMQELLRTLIEKKGEETRGDGGGGGGGGGEGGGGGGGGGGGEGDDDGGRRGGMRGGTGGGRDGGKGW